MYRDLNHNNKFEISYTKQDGIFSVLIYIYILVLAYLFGLFIYKSTLNNYLCNFFKNKDIYKIIIQIPVNVFQLLPIFLLIKIKNQPLISVGLSLKGILKQFLLGLLFSIPFIIIYIFLLLNNKTYFTMESFIFTLIYQLIFTSLIEEIIFRGFIQSRITGLINNKPLSILTVGIMFGLAHWPFQLISNNKPLSEIIIPMLFSLLIRIVMHIYLNFIYQKSNNLIAPIITHTIKNILSLL